MGPHPEAPVDVQKYIGSCLIAQQHPARSKRKSGPRPPHGGATVGAATAPPQSPLGLHHPQQDGGRYPLQSGAASPSGGGYGNLSNYVWTGVPLISVARQKGGGQQHHLSKARQSPRKPLEKQQEQDVNLEDILPISRLAIHAQGAPLILSPKDGEDADGYSFKNHEFYHHHHPQQQHHQQLHHHRQNGHVYLMVGGGPEDLNGHHHHRAIGYSQEETDTELMLPSSRHAVSPSQSDCVSTTSEDSGTSENGLPRIIKPRKRRKKDRRGPPSAGESDVNRDDSSSIPGGIVTLKPYQPLCTYRYTKKGGVQSSVPSSPPSTPKTQDHLRCIAKRGGELYPYPPSSRCRCPHCVPPPSTFLTPPDSPVEISESGLAMAVVRGRLGPPGDPFGAPSSRDSGITLLEASEGDVVFNAGLEEALMRAQQPNSTLVLTSSHPPQRPWIFMTDHDPKLSSCRFTVMCYNILCDKYATRQMYGYCPNWALDWAYRKTSIMQEILHYKADIISLQEVETEQFYKFFLPELKKDGYDGIFSPKSRAKTMSESERKHVDGCAIFYKSSKFFLLKEHLMEFNQLAMANAEGSDDMLNRVMTKDNIGLAALLQTRIGAYQDGGDLSQANQTLLVCTAHIHWDPEYSDVKLIQTMMLMHELKTFVDDILHKCNIPPSQKMDPNSIPLLLCGDFNSLPDSGVIEYLSSGRVSSSHCDFKEIVYKDCLSKLGNSVKTNEFTHPFKISRAYSDGIMPFTNYSYDFKGVIDYVFYSRLHMTVLGVLGPVDSQWLDMNRVQGCPHPHVPSDHFPIVVELQLSPTLPIHPSPPNGIAFHR